MIKKIFLSLGSVVAFVAVRKFFRSSAKKSSVRFVPQRALKRNLQLFRLGARGSSRYALYKARRQFASAEKATDLDTSFQLETAQDVTKELGNMKGAMMKIGQMMSYLDTGLPENVRSTLASLQSDAPPMSPQLAAEQIQKELGALPEDIFLEWAPEPIAAASIGQVHRAITKEGQAVAVKVQYPGIAEAVSADLHNADWIFGGMGKMFPGLDPAPVVAEIKQRLGEELDYEKEAANQMYFREHLEGHPFIHIPKVYSKYSSKEVLTCELAVGSTLDEVLTWNEQERNLTAETLFRFSFGAIYQLHAFNGDPHPGNYIFNKGGKVTFLDFGLVKRFTEPETLLFENLITQMVISHDKKKFRSIVEDAGILAPNAAFSDELVNDYFSYFYEYVLKDQDLTIDQEYSARGVTRIFDTKSEHGDLMKNLNIPPSLVVLQRINLGLMGLFAQLEATANWRRIAEELWPFVQAEPATPMGREVAEWRLATQSNSKES